MRAVYPGPSRVCALIGTGSAWVYFCNQNKTTKQAPPKVNYVRDNEY